MVNLIMSKQNILIIIDAMNPITGITITINLNTSNNNTSITIMNRIHIIAILDYGRIIRFNNTTNMNWCINSNIPVHSFVNPSKQNLAILINYTVITRTTKTSTHSIKLSNAYINK